MSEPNSIRLVSLDFDGTILSYEDPAGVIHHDIIPVLNELADRDVRWVANSGRELADQREVVERSRRRGLTNLPVAYICTETTVHVMRGRACLPLEPWNSMAREQLIAFHHRVQRQLGDLLDDIKRDYQPEMFLVGEHYTAFLIRDHHAAEHRLFPAIEQKLAGLDKVLMSRNAGWVAVNHADLGKGNALRAYAEHAGYTSAEILAIGDHHNDLSKLETGVAAHVGCPGDAIPEVKAAVLAAGGMVATLPGPAGTAQIIRQLAGEGARCAAATVPA
jgi:hydroxymethylpyrimidine pyrophosphatase-like HAD family hydrolase